MDELELKFAISLEDADTLRTAPELCGAAAGSRRVNRFEAIYFDTARYRLRHRRIDFRIKRSAGRIVQTVKRPLDDTTGGGVLARHEFDTRLSDIRPDLNAITPALWDLQPLPTASQMLPVFRTEGTRTRCLIDWGGSRIDLAVDIGRYESARGRPATLPMCELELELVSGAVADLLDFALRLGSKVKLHAISRTKSDHGYALASRSFQPGPTKFKRLPAPADLSSIQGQIGQAMRHYMANDPLVLDDKLEAIHQARVALRRARAILRAHKSRLPSLERRGLNAELKWLQTSMGFARDWQVFQQEVLPDLRIDGDPWLDSITRYARAQTNRNLQTALTECESRRAQTILLELQSCVARLKPAPAKDQKARRRVYRKDLTALTAIDALPGIDNPHDIHAIRILGKKLRYVVDLSPELKTIETKPLRKAIKRIQDLLGRYNDLSKALELFAIVPSSVVSHADMMAFRAAIEARQAAAYEKVGPLFDSLQTTARQALADLENKRPPPDEPGEA